MIINDHGARWVGGSLNATEHIKDITPLLKKRIAKKFTIAQLQTFLNAGSASDATFKVEVQSFAGELGSYYTSWYVSRILLKIYYYTTAPEIQYDQKLQLSTSSTFSSVFWDSGYKLGDGNSITIPSNTMASNTTYYARWAVRNSSLEVSSWSGYVSFKTMPSGMADVISDPSADITSIVEMQFKKKLDGGRWHLYDYATVGKFVYRTIFTRTASIVPRTMYPHSTQTMPLQCWISGFIDDGKRYEYTQFYSIADMLATPTNKSFFFDETNGYLYLTPNDGKSPAGQKGEGITALISVGFSNKQDAFIGPDAMHQALPRIKGKISIVEELSDFTDGIMSSPSGSVTISNYDGLFNRLLTTGLDEAGFFVYNIPVKVYLLGKTNNGLIPYNERFHIFDGMASYSSSDLYKKSEVKFKLSSALISGTDGKYCSRKYAKGTYPNLRDSDDGRPINEVMGPMHYFVPCAVVDKTQKLLRPGWSVSHVYEVKVAGVAIPQSYWTYDTTTNHIRFTSYPTSRNWNNDVNANFTCTCDGGLWGSGGTGTGTWPTNLPGYASHLCQQALEDMGIPRSETVVETFDTMTVKNNGQVSFRFEEETDRIEAIRIIQNAIRYYVIRRADGKFIALDYDILTPYVSSPVLTEANFLDELNGEFNMQNIGFVYKFRITNNQPTIDQKYENFTFQFTPNKDLYGINNEISIDTGWRAWSSIVWLVNYAVPLLPERIIEIKTNIAGWAGTLGGNFTLRSADGIAPDGEHSWDLFFIKERKMEIDTETGAVEVSITGKHNARLTGDDIPI